MISAPVDAPVVRVNRGSGLVFVVFVLGLAVMSFAMDAIAQSDADYYTQEKVYNLRPNPARGKSFGHIGPTGIVAYVNEGVIVTVEDVQEGSPAETLFRKGDVILGVNGESLKGKNPYVVLGKAITEAEASDGLIIFDVKRGTLEMKTQVRIPVRGKYSPTWPLDCPKSKRIIDEAAVYYAKADELNVRDDIGKGIEGRGMEGGLQCLFLLSTGDDRYLPVVRKYFDPHVKNPQGIGDHTWNNGYEGIAVCEYYLRTGDRSVLPVIQFYCDNAKERQKFGCAWPHWGKGINPGYVAGGLMNPASVQILTTLLLAKECGADVDDATLLGSLKFFYRFVGHGTVPYGDHHSEGGLGSNGKDGMLAAAMQIATDSSGDTSIYQSARDYLAMSTLKSYPSLVTGHGDNGRDDGVWRGLSAAYLREKKPKEYRAMMDRLTWWFDLSRMHNGAMGVGTCPGFNRPGSGAGVLLAYTAPLKTLRITGAPKSQYAVDFKLPEYLWGREADLAFHSIEHDPRLFQYGKEIEPHKLLALIGHAYHRLEVDKSGVTKQQLMQNIFHHRYMFRAQSAIGLRQMGQIGELQKLLADKDPRVRRAALDGINDWRYWFVRGKNPLKTEQYTPGMIEKIMGMLRDPAESWMVVEGALWATGNMPAEVIDKNLDAILPWADHEEWWLRQAAFAALSGLDKDPKLFAKVLPKLNEMLVEEYHTQPREYMSGYLTRQMNQKGPGRDAILAAFVEATKESEIKPAPRDREGAYNVLTSAWRAISAEPGSALKIARIMSQRMDLLDTGNLINLVATSDTNQYRNNPGLYSVLKKLDGPAKRELTAVLHDVYLPELVQRLKASDGVNLSLIDTVLALKQLKEDVPGWQELGKPLHGQREWQYVSVDPLTEEDKMLPREKKRFREIALEEKYAGWFKPDYSPTGWNSGRAPIGIGQYQRRRVGFETRSPWGDGEFLLARTTFEVENADYDLYRIRILASQGWYIYLNGKKIATYVWWKNDPEYRAQVLGDNQAKLIHKGTNTLAIYTTVEYPSSMKPHLKDAVLGQIDCYLEGLRKADLY